MSSIPASLFVAVTPSVLGVGGESLDLNGLVVTKSNRVPVGSVYSFASAGAVAAFFGANSNEAVSAGGAAGKGSGYFGGFNNSPKLPGALLFAQYPQSAVSAYLWGASVSSLTLAQLQALSGSLSVVADGVTFAAASINLSGATGFSSAAGIIGAALAAAAPSAASVTASIGGVVTASAGATFTGSGAGTNLTATAVSGVLHPGAALSGNGIPAGTYIVSQTSGAAGGSGVYVTNHVTTSAGDAITAKSNTLDVTGVTSGSLQPTDAISGTGVAANTTILSQISGTPGGIGLYTLNSQQQFSGTAVTSLSTILNVTGVNSGAVEVGALLAGTNVTAGSIVTALGTGTGGVGTYSVSKASTTASETITAAATAPTVTYDSVSGAFVITSGTTGATSSMAFATGTLAPSLNLTSATGAVLSQGSAAMAPAAMMNSVVQVTTNWLSYMTAFDPDGGSGNTQKQAFAAWKNSFPNRYMYVVWDTDVNARAQPPQPTTLAAILTAAGDSGTYPISELSDLNQAAFVMGIPASIDFTQPGGRTTFAFRNQIGLVSDVTTETAAVNLGGNPQVIGDFGNNYNYFGAVASANQNFLWEQRGTITGPFKWADSYINQVWWNSLLQSDLLNLANNAKSIPFSNAGASLIEQALASSIQAGLSFGVAASGTISSSQIAEVNAAAGTNISDTLQTQGYYLQVLQQPANVRANRGPWAITLWYLDRGSVQSFSLSSVALQ